MKRLLLGVSSLMLVASSALAGTSTITTLDASSASHTYRVGTDGSSNFFGNLAICDGTACSNLLAIKAASTAAGASDPSAVVQISPNDAVMGVPGNTACATDNGSCTLNALLQRTNQRLTTLNTTLGSPFQAGGSIGNSTFAATQSGAWTVNPTTAANWGVGATGSGVPANAQYNGGQARSSEPAAATSGNLTGQSVDLTGKTITSPYANRENYLRCAVTITGTSATTCTGMGAQGASVKIYITDLTITRNDAGTTAVSATLNDTATTIVDIPNNGGGGGYAHTFNVPLVVAANTAFQVTMSGSITSMHISATGYAGY